MAAGILAGQSFESRLVGDESLSRRPFDRIVVPLTRMGASVETREGRLPMTIAGGGRLRAIDYELPVASAQVKTAVLLAGLYADGTTRVRESLPSRNHTELALLAFGASPVVRPGEIEIESPASLSPGRHQIPGDFSTAAFFIGASAFLAGSELVVENVGLNPTRAAFLDALRDMGADIEIEATPGVSEPQGRVVVRGRELHGVRIPRETVPALIDELPILAVVAAFASGVTRVEGASELRVKESDRLAAIVEGLRGLGADVTELEDGFEIRGRTAAPGRAAPELRRPPDGDGLGRRRPRDRRRVRHRPPRPGEDLLSGILADPRTIGVLNVTVAIGTERFFLVGFMGTGKTTLGREVAERMGLPFVDLDRADRGIERNDRSRDLHARGRRRLSPP